MKFVPVALAVVSCALASGDLKAQGYVWIWPTQPMQYPMEWCYPCSPGTIEWSSPCFQCDEPSAPTAYVRGQVADETAALTVSPANRYTIINKDGILYAFNGETAELYKQVSGRWQREAGGIPLTPQPQPASP